MKKIVGLCASLLVVLTLTGCGKSNELKCTGKVDDQDVTAVATLSGDKITKVKLETKMETESKEVAEQSVNFINGFGALAAESGMTMSAKANGKNVTTTVVMDVTKMQSEDLEEELGTTELTKDAFVTAMKDKGLTCK